MAADPLPPEYEFRGKSRYIYPLLYVPISDLPLAAKLKMMKQAIKAGDDVNQLDPVGDPHASYGRPLNFAVEYTRANLDYLKDNIPVIKLLLKHGADPRLAGPLGTRSALEEMREMAQWGVDEKDPQYWSELVPFFREAYGLMERRARRLDRRDARRAYRHDFVNRFSCLRSPSPKDSSDYEDDD
ncbi:hypothetical protein F5884DRAFT_830742 [Xylogone sp. PMI_703]|nr:hypothetical protein F5884DRAFT_830742 [Xylogone sp. PMI_703]